MKLFVRLFAVCLFVLSIHPSIFAQSVIDKRTILFPTAVYQLPPAARSPLQVLADSLKANPALVVHIEGHTDTAGTELYNRGLSERRAQAIAAYFIQSGIDPSRLSTAWWWYSRPVQSNHTAAGRRENRRVVIALVRVQPAVTEAPAAIDSIHELYRQLSIEPDSFCINLNRDTVLRCKQGTIIYVKAQSLIPKANCSSACVTFLAKEVFRKSDMIMENLSTTSNGRLLESEGMLYTEARDCSGNVLDLQPGKDIVVMTPTDSVRADAQIFDGVRGHDSVMNWVTDSNSILSTFPLSQPTTCGYWMCGYRPLTATPCPFFFFRIRRTGKAIGGLFNKQQRAANKAFRAEQKRLRNIGDSSISVVSTNPFLAEVRAPLPDSLLSGCKALDSLFKKYGVNNMEALVLALNKPLLDSFKVTSMAALQDTLLKLKTRQIELSYANNKVSFYDFSYYVYNRSRLGWSNVDCFANVPPSRLTTLRVNLAFAKNVDCKLVFKKRRAVMPGEYSSGQYYFPGIPRGETATVVAVKYEAGQPFLAMKTIETNAGPVDVEFRQLTLEALKAALQTLDQ